MTTDQSPSGTPPRRAAPAPAETSPQPQPPLAAEYPAPPTPQIGSPETPQTGYRPSAAQDSYRPPSSPSYPVAQDYVVADGYVPPTPARSAQGVQAPMPVAQARQQSNKSTSRKQPRQSSSATPEAPRFGAQPSLREPIRRATPATDKATDSGGLASGARDFVDEHLSGSTPEMPRWAHIAYWTIPAAALLAAISLFLPAYVSSGNGIPHGVSQFTTGAGGSGAWFLTLLLLVLALSVVGLFVRHVAVHVASSIVGIVVGLYLLIAAIREFNRIRLLQNISTSVTLGPSVIMLGAFCLILLITSAVALIPVIQTIARQAKADAPATAAKARTTRA